MFFVYTAKLAMDGFSELCSIGCENLREECWLITVKILLF